MINKGNKLTKTELKKNGLLKLIERWQQLCLEGCSFEYERNIDCAIRLYRNVDMCRNEDGTFDFYFNKSDWYYELLDDKIPVLCILSIILYYYDDEVSAVIDYHINKTATVRQLENCHVLYHGFFHLQEIQIKSNIIKERNYMAAKLKLDVIPEYDIDYSIAIVAMESYYKLLQNARKDAAEEKLRELFPQHNTYINGTIHNSGTLTGNIITPQYNK